MMKEVHVESCLFSSLSVKLRHSVRNILLTVSCLLMISSLVDGTAVTPSPTQTSFSSSSLSSASYAAITNTLITLPTPTSEPPYDCSTGPETQKFNQFLIATNRMYLDITEAVNCSGVITRWHYCHFIIGFRNATSGLSFCVWRRSNNSENLGYDNVGCNSFTDVPGDGESFRCREHVLSNPAEMITVEEGDHIGFYVPDSALLPALSLPTYDKNHFQLIRNAAGFTSFVKDSELRNLSCTPNCGRALLKAEIDSDWVYPSTVVTPVSIPLMDQPTTPTEIASATTPTEIVPANSLSLTIGLLLSVSVTVVLIFIVAALVVYVSCKNRARSKDNPANLGVKSHNVDMEYNNMYNFRNYGNYVIDGNRRTVMHLCNNPAYESATHDQSEHEDQESSDVENGGCTTTAERRQLEHTYESISNYYANATNIN